MIDRKIFADRLHSLRQSSGLTLEQLAKELGVSTGTVGHWETGFRLPSLEVAVELADYFNVTLDELVGRSHIDSKGT